MQRWKAGAPEAGAPEPTASRGEDYMGDGVSLAWGAPSWGDEFSVCLSEKA